MIKLYNFFRNIIFAHFQGVKTFFIPNRIKIKLEINKFYKDENDLKLCKRIFNFYKKMKMLEPKISIYGPSSNGKNISIKIFIL